LQLSVVVTAIGGSRGSRMMPPRRRRNFLLCKNRF